MLITFEDLKPDLVDLEILLTWFEQKSDPWYTEKYNSKMRDLQSLQNKLCPCDFETHFDTYSVSTTDIKKITVLLNRSNVVSPYCAKGTNVRANELGAVPRIIPPVHVDGCVCDYLLLSKAYYNVD